MTKINPHQLSLLDFDTVAASTAEHPEAPLFAPAAAGVEHQQAPDPAFASAAAGRDSQPEDSRKAYIVEHLQIIAREHDRSLVFEDYNAYRERYNLSLTAAAEAQRERAALTDPAKADAPLSYERPLLPSGAMIYRLFSSWPNALAAAGIASDRLSETARFTDEALIDTLKAAARDLGTNVLTSHEYDRYRRLTAIAHHYSHAKLNVDGIAALQAAYAHAPDGFPAPGEPIDRLQAFELCAELTESELAALDAACKATLPSSSVIRKWMGPWEKAVERAGLSTVERGGMRCFTHDELVEAVRRGRREVQGDFDANSYNWWQCALPEDERLRTPDVTAVINWACTWEGAVANADSQSESEMHPTSLWTRDEARAALRKVSAFLAALRKRRGVPAADCDPTWHEYRTICSRSKLPMPSAEVVDWLLPGRLLAPAAR